MRGSCALLTSEKISIGTASDPDDRSVLAYNLKIKVYYCVIVWIEVIGFFLKYETKCQWFGQKHLTLNQRHTRLLIESKRLSHVYRVSDSYL